MLQQMKTAIPRQVSSPRKSTHNFHSTMKRTTTTTTTQTCSTILPRQISMQTIRILTVIDNNVFPMKNKYSNIHFICDIFVVQSNTNRRVLFKVLLVIPVVVTLIFLFVRLSFRRHLLPGVVEKHLYELVSLKNRSLSDSPGFTSKSPVAPGLIDIVLIFLIPLLYKNESIMHMCIFQRRIPKPFIRLL